MRFTFMLATILIVANSAALRAAETYDLIFKTGTLDGVSAIEGLQYTRDVSIAQDTEFGGRNTGLVNLTFEADDMARLKFSQGDKSKNLGAFPATVGNPIIMYFVETVLRDVAQQAGGSPFYIRNRIKESLVQKAEILDASVLVDGQTVAASQITLKPFENDKNRDKMKGYGDLSLTFTMSDDVPGWYQSLVATVPSLDADTPLYTNSLILDGAEVTE